MILKTKKLQVVNTKTNGPIHSQPTLSKTCNPYVVLVPFASVFLLELTVNTRRKRKKRPKTLVAILNLRARSRGHASTNQTFFAGEAHDNIPLMAQMGKGANRVYSGSGHDSYSLILDEHKDIIYDTGGHNLVAVMLPKGVSFSNVCIGKPLNSDLDRYLIYHVKEVSIGILRKVLLEFRFGGFHYNSFVQFLFKESTGKEIVFKERQKPAVWPYWVTNCCSGQTPSVEEFYQEFNTGKKTWVESVTPAKRSHE